MRGGLLLLICLAAMGPAAAAGTDGTPIERDSAHGAPSRTARSVTGRRQVTPSARSPVSAGSMRNGSLSATAHAHAALHQQMLEQAHPPAAGASASVRSAATARSVIHTTPVGAGGRSGAYRPNPGHGALGGPTTLRTTVRTKALSGVQRRP